MGSIVVPAHNEATAIRTLLTGFGGVAHDAQYETVVVSNGSSDDTAAVARALLGDTGVNSVLELDQPSKIAALRRGDDAATMFPRAYIDADVRIDDETLGQLFDCLRDRPDPVVAAPELQIDASASSALVRSYFRAWTQLPYVRDGVVGVGVYAVNRAGRELMGPFPDVINDDEWVRQRFTPPQRLISRGTFWITAPRNATALVRQRARVEVGNAELVGTGDAGGRSISVGDLVSAVRRRRISFPDATSFIGVVAAIRLLARWRRFRGTSRVWSTDLTSRG